MKLRARIVAVSSLAAACLGVLTFGVARAQQGAAAAVGGTSAELKKPVNLSLEDMNKEGDKAVGRVEMNATNVRRMLEKARTERDVVKTLCLNDKLNQLDVTLRSARERKVGLEAAIARRDTDLSGHEFVILGVFRERADRLFAEANQCVGTDIGTIGDTTVTPTIDPGIPDDYTGPPPTPLNPVIVPPPSPVSPAT